METYTLPREAFDVLEQSLGGKQKAEILAKTLETAIGNIQQRAKEESLDQKQLLRIALKDELKQELVTREIFEERFKSLENVMAEKFKVVDEKFSGLDKQELVTREIFDERFKVIEEKFAGLHFKMNLFIAIALIALTFANPTFVQLLQKIF